METSFVIDQQKLNQSFLNVLKFLFKDSNRLRVTVKTYENLGSEPEETREEYFQKIERRSQNLKISVNTVTFTQSEFDELAGLLQKL